MSKELNRANEAVDAVVIEKDIPIPKEGRSKYPWHDMEIGDSFVIPKLSISTGAVNDRYKPKKFIARKHGNEYRVWRIE